AALAAATNQLGCAGVRVYANPVASGTTQELVNWHAERLALDVPEIHVDPAERTREDRAPAIKRMPVDCLPVMDNPARVPSHQVRCDLLDRSRDCPGASLDDRLAETDDSGVGMDLQEEPSRLDEQGFELGDLDPIAVGDQSS